MGHDYDSPGIEGNRLSSKVKMRSVRPPVMEILVADDDTTKQSTLFTDRPS